MHTGYCSKVFFNLDQRRSVVIHQAVTYKFTRSFLHRTALLLGSVPIFSTHDVIAVLVVMATFVCVVLIYILIECLVCVHLKRCKAISIILYSNHLNKAK